MEIISEMNANFQATAAEGVDLVDLVVDETRAALLKNIAANLPDITLNDRHCADS
jgi:hypothetical protein